MKNKTLFWCAVILGILFIAIAVFYWITPAGSLPAFVPGYQAGSSIIHTKHAALSLILGVLLFIVAWFSSGTKK